MNALAASLALVLLLVLPARAQQILTLEDCIRMARAGSPDAEVARLQFQQAQADLRVFRSTLRPSLQLNGEAPGLQRSISDIQQDDGSVRYVEQNRTFSTLRLSASQALPLTGGQVFVSSGLSRIQLFGNFDQTEWQAAPLLIGLTQPLFQFNALRWDRRTEPLRFRIAQRTYAEDLEDVALDVTSRFFDVYLAEMNVDILAFNVAVNDTIYTLSQGRYDIGRIAENDLLQSELALLNAQTALANATIAYERAVRDLKIALRLPYDADVEILPPTDFPAVDVDPALAVVQARRNRAAFLQQDLAALQAEREVARTHRTSGFSATLSASYGLNQRAENLDNVYVNPLDQQRFSINFQMPVFQWGRNAAERAAAEAALAETEQAQVLERERLEQDVHFEALQFRQLQEQMRIAAKADTVAARRFEVARSRYLIGTIDITDLFDAQREKDSARRAYIQTLRDYWTSYFRLRRLTLYDFARARPVPMPWQ